MSHQDHEIQQYRELMDVPETFEDGFGWKTLIGALFLGFLIVPGSIYLTLFMGASLGPAARWVTVILFAEVAKRSMKSLKQQEIFVLFYMTGIILSSMGGNIGLLWHQYYAQSAPAQAMGIDIPWWYAPPAEQIEAVGRTFFVRPWLPAVAFMVGMLLLGRLDHFSLGYALYRITAHVEKLPFPMAPVGALGVTALSDSQDPANRWKWRCFSIGGVLGLGFGLIYIGIPAITGAVFGRPIEILPIPWLDLTPAVSTREFLPAMPVNLVFDLSLILIGMMIPFWAVVGGFIGLLITLVLNPMLYRAGMLTLWQPGMGVVDTLFSNHVDFYLSFGIGLTFSIFVVSLGTVFRPAVKRFFDKRRRGKDIEQAYHRPRPKLWSILTDRNPERGDLSILMALGIYVFSTCTYIAVCAWLMPGTAAMNFQDRFPWEFFLLFGFIYVPIISYTNAKLEGLVGQTVAIPMVREAAYILSGYRGSAIWFAPVPLGNYGPAAEAFRVTELTGTKLTSLIKTELLAIPILICSVILFSELIYRLAPIPSEVYPFTQEVWHLQALNFSLTATSTQGGSSPFLEALKPGVIGWGLGGGLLAFAVLRFLNLPTFLIYGVVRGLGQTTPGAILPEMVGALIGRFYFQKKFGHQTFKRYMAVVLAGFMAGMGLIGMGSVALALIVKSTGTLGY